MTDDEFMERAAICSFPADAWMAKYRQITQELLRTNRSVEIGEPGRLTWYSLTPVEQAEALPLLWRAYYWQEVEEQRSQRLAADVREGTSYLENGDVTTLWDCIFDAPEAVTNDDLNLSDVPATALQHVLMELELLRHKLDLIEGGDEQ